jgi:Mat/Ecp fimbriae periplasmic chaperone
MLITKRMICSALALGTALCLPSLASAEMVLSQVIVDLLPGKPPREDIEVWNDGDERMYVLAEPFEIRSPGTSAEERIPARTPEESGVLVSPQRLVIEPGERRTVRVAAIGERSASDRVYRVAIRPVAGAVTAESSALKLFVGYDTLVLVRPERFTGDIDGERSGRTLTLRNNGNTAQELFDGRQCDSAGRDCRELPPKRLYPGATWQQTLPFETPVSYKSAIGPTIRDRQY